MYCKLLNKNKTRNPKQCPWLAGKLICASRWFCMAFSCILKVPAISQTYLRGNSLTALLWDFSTHLMLKMSWLADNIFFFPFLFVLLHYLHTAVMPWPSRKAPNHALGHLDSSRGSATSWPWASFSSLFCLFRSRLVSPTICVVPSTYATQPLHNTIRQAVNIQEEQYHTHYKQRKVSIEALEAEYFSASQAAAAA